MVEFRWIKMSLFLMLVLHFTAAVTRQSVSYFTVRVKDEEVILPCNNVIDGQNNCNSTTWIFTGSKSRSLVALIDLGKIDENAKAKDRLSVTENCSLVIKNVTVEDVGQYDCQQYKSHIPQGPDAVVHLSVVSMTEHQNHDEVTLTCSVSTYEPCRHTVKWLYEGKEVDKDNRDVTTSQPLCSASVRVLTYHHIYKSEFKYLKCSVTDGDKEQQLFPFRLQSSGNKPGEETTTTTTSTTTTTTSDDASTELPAITATNSPPTNDASTKPIDWWWLFIILAVVLVALLIIAAKVVRKKKADENKSWMGDDVGLASTQSAPGTSQSTAYPEDGVHYASVNYTDSKAKVRGKNDDKEEGGDVTYTMVKASSADPSCLYATVKK
ncbi:uncharacterized protein LOC115574676 isoform X1 [Sparus aurata]|uniref:uncharacterized protein LOC115574676 isoform X1 n=1 Tax=Sparus aurata TaxID=8175 RepID=UPI0011C12EFA|nr:uncharacterized protein LOC115574676 isoform X1 [Sparus aurata]